MTVRTAMAPPMIMVESLPDPTSRHHPMAGHSKWANIQHRKKAQDARRGKLFTKLVREVTIAAREGGGDPDGNARLRLAMEKAFAGNVPKDTVDRAIRRATGESGADTLEEVRYEGYGPGGTAVMVDCVTDNRNRTVADIRFAFTKCGRQPRHRRLGGVPVRQGRPALVPARHRRGSADGGRARGRRRGRRRQRRRIRSRCSRLRRDSATFARVSRPAGSSRSRRR